MEASLAPRFKIGNISSVDIRSCDLTLLSVTQNRFITDNFALIISSFLRSDGCMLQRCEQYALASLGPCACERAHTFASSLQIKQRLETFQGCSGNGVGVFLPFLQHRYRVIVRRVSLQTRTSALDIKCVCAKAPR